MDRCPDDHTLLVACLCAGWCTTCDAYRPVLAQVAAQMAARQPQARFAWIDIEDDADALGDDALDIATFPTVMVLQAGRVLFHGTLLPHAGTLQRLLDGLLSGAATAPGSPVPAAMAAAVWRLGPQRPLSAT